MLLKFVNIKHCFSKLYNKTSAIGMNGMLIELNIELVGHHHSGIDDCNNIAAIFTRLINDGLTYDMLPIINIDYPKIITSKINKIENVNDYKIH
jgi:inhibitor of KinA sporulation pathway (predicted exonuclease)